MNALRLACQSLLGAFMLSFLSLSAEGQSASPTQDQYATGGGESPSQSLLANTGQDFIADNPTANVSSAIELDAIRLEIIEQRRFVVILGGIFFGWAAMRQLFRAH